MDKTLVCGPQCVTHLYSCGQTFLNMNSGGTFSVCLCYCFLWINHWCECECEVSLYVSLWWAGQLSSPRTVHFDDTFVFHAPPSGEEEEVLCAVFFSFFFCKKELKYAIFLLYSPLTRTKPHFFRKVYRQKRNSVPFCVHTLSSFQRGPGFSFWSMSALTEPQSSFLAAFMWVLETETPSKR